MSLLSSPTEAVTLDSSVSLPPSPPPPPPPLSLFIYIYIYKEYLHMLHIHYKRHVRNRHIMFITIEHIKNIGISKLRKHVTTSLFR